jgi:hypothetical protein
MTMDTRKKHPFDDIWRRKRPNGGASWAGWNPPPEPEPENIPKDEWPIPKERTDLVFAKCCTPEHWGSTHAGSDPMPASDFGKVMLAGSMLVPSAAEAAGLALGFDAVLGRVAGGGIMQKGFTGHCVEILRACLCWACFRPKWATAPSIPTISYAA